MCLPRPADSRPSPAHPVADSDRWAKARKPNSAARRAGEQQLERCTGGELPIKAHAHAPHTVVQLFRNPSSAAVYSSGCLRRWPTCSDTCHRTSRTSAHVPFCRRAATSSASLCKRNKVAQPSASWLSRGSSRRQIVPHAAPRFGQPWAAGLPYRALFST